LRIKRDTAIILLICLSVSLAAFIFAFFYYRDLNRSEDPRMLKARQWLGQSDEYIAAKESMTALRVLDSALSEYDRFPLYSGSFEYGIIYNNKCSALLMEALYDSTLSQHEKEQLLRLARKQVDSSILFYQDWMKSWGALNPDQIQARISPFFQSFDEPVSNYRKRKILKKRVEDIRLAQIETPRRISVALTNLGTILRHQQQADSALICFNSALKLWKHNRVATSNLAVLKGGNPVKTPVLETLFPPDKTKKE